MSVLHIAGMWGLGDNIFQRPFIRAASYFDTVYLDTPWPELYSDLPIKFVRNREREGRLRTQTKNMRAQPIGTYSTPPKAAQLIRMGYGHATMRSASIVVTMESLLPLRRRPFVFDLPEMGASPIRSAKPIAIVRPVTERTEWRNTARNPRPEYVAQIAARLMATHTVVSVADLVPGQEWILPPVPPAHIRMHRGELSVRQLLALVRAADIVVGGVGWIVPASCAMQTDCFVILGGHGAHNHPNRITDRRMGLDRLGFAIPDRFCMCSNMKHTCDRRIGNLDEQFDDWLETIEEVNRHARAGAA